VGQQKTLAKERGNGGVHGGTAVGQHVTSDRRTSDAVGHDSAAYVPRVPVPQTEDQAKGQGRHQESRQQQPQQELLTHRESEIKKYHQPSICDRHQTLETEELEDLVEWSGGGAAD